MCGEYFVISYFTSGNVDQWNVEVAHKITKLLEQKEKWILYQPVLLVL